MHKDPVISYKNMLASILFILCILDPDTPMEEIVRAFNWCIDKGMALYWGTSEWPSYLITEAMNVANRLQLIAPITEVNFL